MAPASEPDSPAHRRRAAIVAGYSGDERAARSALAGSEGAERAAGLSALSRMGGLRPEDLVVALADPAPAVRRRACDLAARYQVPGLVSRLVGALADSDPSVAEAACYALGELLPDSAPDANAPDANAPDARATDVADAVPALSATASSHPEPLCREAAVAALGAVGDSAGLDAVLGALADKPAVRRRAVVALANFEGAQVDAALAMSAQDLDWQVRQAAEDLLSDRRPS